MQQFYLRRALLTYETRATYFTASLNGWPAHDISLGAVAIGGISAIKRSTTTDPEIDHIEGIVENVALSFCLSHLRTASKPAEVAGSRQSWSLMVHAADERLHIITAPSWLLAAQKSNDRQLVFWTRNFSTTIRSITGPSLSPLSVWIGQA